MHLDQEKSQVHSNKGMQTDIFTRYASENAADAGRYATLEK